MLTDKNDILVKMPPLDGCEGGEMVVILQQKPDLDGVKGFCTNFVCRTCTHFLGGPYEKLIPPSI